MEGKKIKEILRVRGISISEAARRIGTSQANLSSILSGPDVKSGIVESIAAAIGEPVTFFYTGESSGTAVVSGGTVNGDVTGKKEEGKAVDALVEQLDRKDRQIDRLLALLEKK